VLLPGGSRLLFRGFGFLQGGVARGLGGSGVSVVLIAGGRREGSNQGRSQGGAQLGQRKEENNRGNLDS